MVEGQVLTPAQNKLGDTPFTGGASLHVAVISDAAAFDAMAGEWDAFAGRWAPDSLFVSHAWFRSWWEAFGEGKQLHIVVVRSEGRLVAIAPMMRTKAHICRINVDALYTIYNPHTPRYDFIVAHNDPRIYEAIWTELASHDCGVIALAQMPEDSCTLQRIRTFGEREGWITGQWIAPPSPFIRLGCEYEAYFNSLRSGCQFNLKKRYARLRKSGVVEVEYIRDRHAISDAMADGLRIEAAAWKGAHGTAILSDPAVTDFYMRFAERQADLGQLRLAFLRVGGKRIAFNYLLQSGRKLYALKIGYDPEFHAYSPGNMLLNLILKDACAWGIEEYDLLGGDDDWKFEWTKEKREHRWLFLFRNKLRPRLLHGLKFHVAPLVRRWF